jgi:hypothetical protein
MQSEIFSPPVNGTTTISEDNHSCIVYTQNVLVRETTKHIDLNYHFVKDHMYIGTVKLRCLPIGDMVVDMLTQPMLGRALERHRSAILGTTHPCNYTSRRGVGTSLHSSTRHPLPILRGSVMTNSYKYICDINLMYALLEVLTHKTLTRVPYAQ